MAKQEVPLKTLYFYFLNNADNDIRVEETKAAESPKTYRLLPGNKRPDGYYGTMVKKRRYWKISRWTVFFFGYFRRK